MRTLFTLHFLLILSSALFGQQKQPADTLIKFYNKKGKLSHVVLSGATIKYRTKDEPNEIKTSQWTGVSEANFLLQDSILLDTSKLSHLEVKTTPIHPFIKGVDFAIKTVATSSFLILTGTTLYGAHLFRQAEFFEEYAYALIFIIAAGSIVSAFCYTSVAIWRVNELNKFRVLKKNVEQTKSTGLKLPILN